MAGNTFGSVFRVTTFGESHGQALGCIIDGCPSGLKIDKDFIQSELDRRRPGAAKRTQDGTASLNPAVTARNEADSVEILSGIFEGKSTGTPIALLIRNTNQNSSDYEAIKDIYRPGHADFTYMQKYGRRDYRGGGRSSGRETCARVAAGAIAKLLLKEKGILVKAFTEKVGDISIDEGYFDFKIDDIESDPLRCPNKEVSKKMQEKIALLKKEGNSIGGVVGCIVRGERGEPLVEALAGLGEPVFDKCDALIAQAILSIGAIKGIEFGEGFKAAESLGSENNDPMSMSGGSAPTFITNKAGGTLGGITTGYPIIFRAAVKPVPSIRIKQKTITEWKEDCDIMIEGRHDVCLCPRIVPVIEAMTAITIADLYLRNKTARLTDVLKNQAPYGIPE